MSTRHGNNLRRIPKKSLSTEARLYGYIQEATDSDDGRGGESTVWANAHPEPHAFAVLPLSAKQVWEYESINVEASHLVKIRAQINITEFNRLLISNRIFEIKTIEDIQERGYVKHILTKERRS